MNHDLKIFLKENWLRIASQTVLYLVLLGNMWIAYRLAPILVSIDRLNDRVLAVENDYSNHIDETRPLIAGFLKIEEKVDNMAEDIKEIKQDVKDIERKL